MWSLAGPRLGSAGVAMATALGLRTPRGPGLGPGPGPAGLPRCPARAGTSVPVSPRRHRAWSTACHYRRGPRDPRLLPLMIRQVAGPRQSPGSSAASAGRSLPTAMCRDSPGPFLEESPSAGSTKCFFYIYIPTLRCVRAPVWAHQCKGFQITCLRAMFPVPSVGIWVERLSPSAGFGRGWPNSSEWYP